MVSVIAFYSDVLRSNPTGVNIVHYVKLVEENENEEKRPGMAPEKSLISVRLGIACVVSLRKQYLLKLICRLRVDR